MQPPRLGLPPPCLAVAHAHAPPAGPAARPSTRIVLQDITARYVHLDNRESARGPTTAGAALAPGLGGSSGGGGTSSSSSSSSPSRSPLRGVARTSAVSRFIR
jgi:hypothetical protein